MNSSINQYDNKPYTLGGAVLAVAAWIYTGGNIFVPIGIMGLALRAAKAKDLEQDVIDAPYTAHPIALPGETPDTPSAISPVAISNSFSPKVTIATSPSPSPSPSPKSSSSVNPTVSTQLDFGGGSSEIETIDTPKQIAQSIIDGRSAGHLLLSCRTGSGKTTTLRAAMRALYEGEQPQFVVVDPKGSDWMGLKDKHLLRVGQEDIRKLVGACQQLVKILQKRIEDRSAGSADSEYERIVLILDEWPSLLAFAEMAGLKRQLLESLQILLLQGREDRMNLWVVGQSHLVQDIGFNRTVQTNFDIFALGKPQNLESVRAIAADQHVVKDARKRNALLDEISALEQSYQGESPLVFSSINGGRISVLPDLRAYIDWRFPE